MSALYRQPDLLRRGLDRRCSSRPARSLPVGGLILAYPLRQHLLRGTHEPLERVPRQVQHLQGVLTSSADSVGALCPLCLQATHGDSTSELTSIVF